MAEGLASEYWVNILEREGWLVINVEDRKLGIVISTIETGQQYLRVAGFHLGDSMYVGERRNILAVKVERIPMEKQDKMLPVIQEALPVELHGLPIVFL
jgi:hypothetical protein